MSSANPPDGFYDTMFALEKFRATHLRNDSDDRETPKDLPNASFLALCMVSAPSEFAAAYIHTQSNKLTVYLSKNPMSPADKQYALSLASITKSTKITTGNCEYELAFLGNVASYCSRKIEKSKQKLVEADLELISKEFSNWASITDSNHAQLVRNAVREEEEAGERRRGDVALKEYCIDAKLGVISAMDQTFKFLVENFVNPTKTAEVFMAVSTLSHMLGTSVICRRVLSAVVEDPIRCEKVQQGLIRFGRYARGVTRLKGQLINCFKSLPEINVVFVPSRRSQQRWTSTAEQVLWRVYSSHLRHDLSASVKRHLSILARTIAWKNSAEFILHDEIALVLFLKKIGIKSGEIGVSKSCCGICWTMIRAFNGGGDKWKIRDNHGNVYLSLATGILEVDLAALRHMQSALVKIIEAFLLTCRNAKSVGVPSQPASSPRQASSLPLLKIMEMVSKAPSSLPVNADSAVPTRHGSQAAVGPSDLPAPVDNEGWTEVVKSRKRKGRRPYHSRGGKLD